MSGGTWPLDGGKRFCFTLPPGSLQTQTTAPCLSQTSRLLNDLHFGCKQIKICLGEQCATQQPEVAVDWKKRRQNRVPVTGKRLVNRSVRRTLSSCCLNAKHRGGVRGHSDVSGGRSWGHHRVVTPGQFCYRQWKLLLPRVFEHAAAVAWLTVVKQCFRLTCRNCLENTQIHTQHTSLIHNVVNVKMLHY